MGIYNLNSVFLSLSSEYVTNNLQLMLNANDTRSYPGTGITWYDVSGNDRHCTWSSTPTFSTDSSYNNIKYFTTLGNSCTGPASNSFGIDNTSGYTIIHVFRQLSLVNTSGFQFLSSNGSTGVAARGIFGHSTWGDEVYYFDQGGCCNADTRTSVYVGGSTTGYHMYAVRKSATARNIFKNGSSLVTNTTPAADINLDSRAVYISGTPEAGGSSSTWNARLHMFMVYNRALTDSEIIKNYNAYVAGEVL